MSSRYGRFTLLLTSLVILGCSGSTEAGTGGDGGTQAAGGAGGDGALFSVGSVVVEPTGRTLFVQTVRDLSGTLSLEDAIEAPGNSRHWAFEGAVYVGLGEEPTLIRYLADDNGTLQVDRRLSFQRYGISGIPAGAAFLSADKAYLLLHEALVVVVFDPTDMVILDEIDISDFAKPNLTLETWFVTQDEDRLYVPIRRVNENSFEIDPNVAVAIFDTVSDEVIGLAEDDRCVAASRPAIGPDGHIYVLGDGRNFLTQIISEIRGLEVPPTCILRIRQGEAEFDPEFYVDMNDITGGRDAATAMWQVPGFRDAGFAKMYYPEEVPPDVEVTGFNVWNYPVYKLWRIELGDVVTAVETEDQPFSLVDFGAVPVDGELYFGNSPDAGGTTTVFRIDPAANSASPAFEITGALREIYRLR
ncbi:MAG: DUF4374 domain-containing protein [Myxococcota bacterium]